VRLHTSARLALAVSFPFVCGACAPSDPPLSRLSDQPLPKDEGQDLPAEKPQNEVMISRALPMQAPAAEASRDAVLLPLEKPPQTPLGERCFGEIFDPNVNGPDYDQFNPTVGSHCLGTNHQDIQNIERVVFLGDSVTQGSPPTPIRDRYRLVLTDMLKARFGRNIEITNCSAWGARTDDLLMPPHQQIHECFPSAVHPERTLVIMTIGGNDVANAQKSGAEGAPYAETRAQVEAFVQLLRESIEWFYADPNRFPNGVSVVFSNMFEFTDGTGDVSSCPAARVAGFSGEWPDAEELVIWANEQYMSIAVETQTDMIFMLENFCGHGFLNEDPNGRCYRGPNTERWFDFTCIHPNATGHHEIARMFFETITE
jgi:hypothetical protein